MKRVLLILGAALAALCFSAARADDKPDPNYVAALNAVTAQRGTADAASAAWADAVTEKNKALPAAIAACAQFKNDVSQVICALGVTGNLGGVGQQLAQGPAGAPAVSVPAPPPQQEHWGWQLAKGSWNVGLAVVDRLLGWKTISEGRKERTEIAKINGETQVGLFREFGGFGGQAVAAVQNTAIAGFDALGRPLPAQAPTTVWNVSGYGNNFGPGNMTWNPVTNSYNPTNPAARVCSLNATGVMTCNP